MSVIKYPRTPHLPWSPGATSDDAFLKSLSHFEGNEVVVTEKMDGENTSMYRDHIHARSTDSAHHPSRTMVKKLHASIAHDIPDGWRICGENLYARHSIAYTDLPSVFLVFSIWNEENMALSWSETETWAKLLGLTTVPVLFKGRWKEDEIMEIYKPTGTFGEMEGYVVRLSDAFLYKDFDKSVAKFVRKNHVQTDGHWMTSAVVPNKFLTF